MSFERKKRKLEASAAQEPKSEAAKPVEAEEEEDAVAPEAAPAFDPAHPMAAKAAQVMASSMPEAQKQKYLRDLGVVQGASDTGKVPFNVYARVRKVAKDRLKAMEVYPKAKEVRLATIEAWDEIFKAF